MLKCSEDCELRRKKKETAFRSLYIRNWKRGGFYPAQILKRNPDRWIKTPPLDAKGVTSPKLLNEALRVPKRQKQLWNDENVPSTCKGLNVFMVLNVIMFTSQNYTFSPRARGEKLKFWGAIVGGKDLSFCVGPQTPFINKNASEEEKMLGNAS